MLLLGPEEAEAVTEGQAAETARIPKGLQFEQVHLTSNKVRHSAASVLGHRAKTNAV